MGKKVYAIKEGFDFKTNKKVENRIVSTWPECLKYVKGVKGAKYKSFQNTEEANAYLNKDIVLLKKSDNNYPKDCLHIYVDGSYNNSTERYAYGLVAVRDDIVEYIDSGASKDCSKKNIRQIAGELEAAVKALEYAIEKGEKKVVIFHDYEGICYHATGAWERREDSSIEYYKKMNELMKVGLEVIFVKVDSHTGDFFNELVDEKCKEKVIIDSDKAVEKWLHTNILKVTKEEIKEEILELAPNSKDNIEVISSNDVKRQEFLKEQIFKEIIKQFKIDKKQSIYSIDLLSEKDKKEFILYLLNKSLI